MQIIKILGLLIQVTFIRHFIPFHLFCSACTTETHLEESHKSVFGFENRQRLENKKVWSVER